MSRESMLAGSAGRGVSAAELAAISTSADLTASLRRLWENSGKLSMRRIEIISKGALKRATINDLLKGVSTKPRWETVWEFVKALHGDDGEASEQSWREAWERAHKRARTRVSEERRSLLSQYRDVSQPWFRSYLGMEETACSIRCYESQFIPGLLQTEEYASSVVSFYRRFPEEEAQRHVSLRRERQRRLWQGKLKLWALVDEVALLRPLAGVDTQIRQLYHLYGQCKTHSNLTLKIRRDGSSGYVVPTGFSIIQFPEDSVPDVVYVEILAGASYLRMREDVDRYKDSLERLAEAADDSSETLKRLEYIIKDLEVKQQMQEGLQ